MEPGKEIKVCFKCLRYRKFRHRCNLRPCGVDGCRRTHHPLLHSNKITGEEPTTSQHEATTTLKAVVTSARHRSSSTLLKMIPVVIRGATATLSTFALLDEGSTVTLMEAAVAERVGATGPKEPFTIEGVAGARINANESRKISITIRGLHQKAEHPLVAHTVRDLHIAPQSIPDNIVEECEHLADIRSQITYASGTPTILLGQDNWHLIVTRGVRAVAFNSLRPRSPNWAGCCTVHARVVGGELE
ncbi:hypothetical protein EVAR_91985_1 [Eumeta japonica]|uniref:Peptidase A2 domain-containing protein n=1 Tax=Eumeta variegata TaxID=151549 RepID=A0A4C2ACG0_EUMVA|nr:hypothetical protein EVAR_91985_1 [Eumeta japonica]